MYVATRGLFRMRLPTIFVPVCIADLVARLFEVHRHGPVRARAQARAAPGWGGVPAQEGPQGEGVQNLPSQGYVVYAVKQKLKQEYLGLPGSEIKRLKLSGVEITNTVTTPHIAFTGDTMSDFITDPDNADVLKAKILVVESTFLDDSISIELAKEYGHTHLLEIVNLSDKLDNKCRFSWTWVPVIARLRDGPGAGRPTILLKGRRNRARPVRAQEA